MRAIFSLPVIFTIFVVLSFPLQAEITSLASAINKAGRQRMLSQRILKTHSMIGLDVNTLSAREQMQQAIALFDTQLEELEAYTPNEEVKKGLVKVRTLWGPYKKAVTQTVNRDEALQLFQLSSDLLAAFTRSC